eukprot:scaffold6276_cov138-Cylindrotheca_fusiformis.AAC.1
MKATIRLLLGFLASAFLVLQGAVFYVHTTLNASGRNNLPLDGTSSNTDNINNNNRQVLSIDLNDEIRKSKEYVDSIQDLKRKLVFVHIPKTAGSTIEDVGSGQAKLAWGSCMFNHRPKRKLCKAPVMLYPKEFEWPMK